MGENLAPLNERIENVNESTKEIRNVLREPILKT